MSSGRRPWRDPRIWLLASTISGLLLALVISQLDLASLRTLRAELDPLLLALALGFLGLEGLASAERIHLFTRASRRGALRANAMQAVLVAVLPTRLGDLAAVLPYRRHLGMKGPGALASIVVQRLFDLGVLAALFASVALFAAELVPRTASLLAGLTATAIALLALLNLEGLLAFAARVLLGAGRSQRLASLARPLRRLARIALEARRWKRHALDRRSVWLGTLVTGLKWLANIAAIVAVLLGAGAPISLVDALVVAVGYHAIGVVPLQTVGGIGAADLGLVALLASLDVERSTAAALAVLLRLILFVFPFVFQAIVRMACGPGPGSDRAAGLEMVDVGSQPAAAHAIEAKP